VQNSVYCVNDGIRRNKKTTGTADGTAMPVVLMI